MMSEARTALVSATILLALAVGLALSQAPGPASELRGEALFSNNCAACHGIEGGGRLGPALRGNERLADPRYLVAKVLLGGGGMPAFHDRLSVAQIASVTEHVANAWGNDYGPVPTAQVAEQWPEGAGRGLEIYLRNCARCHGEEGGGFLGPRLMGNPNLESADYVVQKIRHGDGGMPAFDGLLDGGQIAEVATFIRTSWGNRFGPVEADSVESEQRTIEQAPGGGGLQPEGRPDTSYARQLPAEAVAPTVDEGGIAEEDGSAPAEEAGGGAASPGGPGGDGGESSGGQASAAGAPEAESENAGTETEEPATEGDGGEGTAELVEEGAAIYAQQCASCHGPEGGGGAGPALAGNPALEDADMVVEQILHGGGGMPAFGDRLNDREVAAVASHVRTAWENDFGPVEPRRVASRRQGGEGGAEGAGEADAGESGGTSTAASDGEEDPSSEDGEGAVQEQAQEGDAQGGTAPAEGTAPEDPGEGEGETAGPHAEAGGNASRERPTRGPSEPPVLTRAEAVALYEAACASCHGARGGGGVGPAFAGNPRLDDVAYTVSRIAMGGGGMPPFNELLSSGEVAALGTLIRTSWGNGFGGVSVQEAKRWHSHPGEPAVYFAQNCSGCHGFAGSGHLGPGPALSRNPELGDASHVVRQIIYGGGGMPPFGDELTPEEVAAMASYVRTKWGNEHGPVELELVLRELRSPPTDDGGSTEGP